jgi:hypothetical protein
MIYNAKKLFHKHASIKVKGFTKCMTLNDFEKACDELLVRLQIKAKNKKKNVK